MPKLTWEGNPVNTLDLGYLVEDYVSKGDDNPDRIAKALMAEPSIKTRLNGSLIYKGHVKQYLDRQASIAKGEVMDAKATALLENPHAKDILHATQNRIQGLMSQSESWETITTTLLRDIHGLMRKATDQDYNVCRECGGEVLEYPLNHIKTAATALKASIEVIRAIKGDEGLKQIVRAGTINQKVGASEEEVLDTLFRVGAECGLSREAVTRAYVKVKSSPRGDVVDAEVVE